MNNVVLLPAALSLVLLVGGCTASPAQTSAAGPSASVTGSPSPSATTPTPTAVAPQTAEGWANLIKQPTSTKIVVITENNDPNDLLGRPNGYTDAAVIYDKGSTCSSLGTDCGATIEIWPSAAEAQKRSDYIQGVLKDTPAFGTEYHTLNGKALLRVTGKIKPSVAKTYQTAFAG